MFFFSGLLASDSNPPKAQKEMVKHLLCSAQFCLKLNSFSLDCPLLVLGQTVAENQQEYFSAIYREQCVRATSKAYFVLVIVSQETVHQCGERES